MEKNGDFAVCRPRGAVTVVDARDDVIIFLEDREDLVEDAKPVHYISEMVSAPAIAYLTSTSTYEVENLGEERLLTNKTDLL